MAKPTIDWANKIINIPLSYLTLISGSVYSLDTNQFHLDLRELEASSDGMPFIRTHKHNTTVTLSGITYARTVEIVNGYTITFEVGNYAVILEQANNNVIDVMNFNGVSVLGNNSAGLIDAALIAEGVQVLQYDHHVHINVNEGVAGTEFPTGTEKQPSNNLVDALTIMNNLGLEAIRVDEDLTIGATDNVDGISISGSHAIKSQITLAPGCSTVRTQFTDCQLTGTADGPIIIRESLVSDLVGFQGIMFQTALSGFVRPASSPNASLMLQCFAEAPENYAELDLTDISTAGFAIRDWNGPGKITNLTVDAAICVDYAAAKILIDGTVTNGRVHITGSGGLVFDDSNGTAVVDLDGAMTADQLYDLYTTLGLNKLDEVEITPEWLRSASGNINVLFSGDGVNSTVMARQ